MIELWVTVHREVVMAVRAASVSEYCTIAAGCIADRRLACSP